MKISEVMKEKRNSIEEAKNAVKAFLNVLFKYGYDKDYYEMEKEDFNNNNLYLAYSIMMDEVDKRVEDYSTTERKLEKAFGISAGDYGEYESFLKWQETTEWKWKRV